MIKNLVAKVVNYGHILSTQTIRKDHQKYLPVKPVVLSVRSKAHEMCLFTTNEPGETTRKLRHDIIYSSLSIRLSTSPIDCAFNLLQRLWLPLLNAGCKVNCTIKRQSILNKVWVICVGIITMRSCRVVYPLVTFSSFTI